MSLHSAPSSFPLCSTAPLNRRVADSEGLGYEGRWPLRCKPFLEGSALWSRSHLSERELNLRVDKLNIDWPLHLRRTDSTELDDLDRVLASSVSS